MQAGRPILRHVIRDTGRWRRSPLQDFLQVKVRAKALDFGEDPHPCKSQELPALGVNELYNLSRSIRQLVG
jgi:hypothetical protein